MSRIGLLGGTFNPIHNGHLILAETAKDALSLDEVWFLPTGCSYLKDPKEILPTQVRGQLTGLAIADNPIFRLCTIEMEREGNTYTADTLDELHEQYPEHTFYYIVGADILYTIEKWYHPERIFAGCVLACAVRNNSLTADLERQADYLRSKYNAQITLIPSVNIEISSTMIRSNCAQNRSIRYLVPKAVEDVILQEKYYI